MTARRWTLQLDGVLLPGPNRLIRMHAQEYRKLRDELLLLARASLTPAAPATPLAACHLRITLQRPARSLLDVDAKYGAIKPLLDVLQAGRSYTRKIGGHSLQDTTVGLSLIHDDRDGEGELTGCIRSLQVVQVVGEPRVEVVIEEDLRPAI